MLLELNRKLRKFLIAKAVPLKKKGMIDCEH
jgi:hypothetical protein